MRHLDWKRERGLGDGLVFTNQDGSMLRPWTFTKRDLERRLAAAGITKSVTLYGLRHTFATLHVQAGRPLKVVSGVLGHATIQQTANTYMYSDQALTAAWMHRYEAIICTSGIERSSPRRDADAGGASDANQLVTWSIRCVE